MINSKKQYMIDNNTMLIEHLNILKVKYCLPDVIIGYYRGLYRERYKVNKYEDGSHLIRFEMFIKKWRDYERYKNG